MKLFGCKNEINAKLNCLKSFIDGYIEGFESIDVKKALNRVKKQAESLKVVN